MRIICPTQETKSEKFSVLHSGGNHSVHLLRGHSVWGVLVNVPRVSPGTIFLNPAELPLVTDTIIMVKEKARKLPQESKNDDAVSLP